MTFPVKLRWFLVVVIPTGKICCEKSMPISYSHAYHTETACSNDNVMSTIKVIFAAHANETMNIFIYINEIIIRL